MEEFRRLSADTRSTLLALNIADDYFKAKESVDKYQMDMIKKKKRSMILSMTSMQIDQTRKLRGKDQGFRSG